MNKLRHLCLTFSHSVAPLVLRCHLECCLTDFVAFYEIYVAHFQFSFKSQSIQVLHIDLSKKLGSNCLKVLQEAFAEHLVLVFRSAY